ncbi:Serine/threonine-protein kinase 36, partial [Operophtera brumata]
AFRARSQHTIGAKEKTGRTGAFRHRLQQWTHEKITTATSFWPCCISAQDEVTAASGQETWQVQFQRNTQVSLVIYSTILTLNAFVVDESRFLSTGSRDFDPEDRSPVRFDKYSNRRELDPYDNEEAVFLDSEINEEIRHRGLRDLQEKSMESYMVISFIGEGSFGRVFKAKHKETDAIVALKVIRKKGRSPKDLKNLKQECEIQRQLKHPNIIRMIDSFDTESELVVVTEYAEKELHSILAKEGCLNEDQVKKITWDLVSALYYLHSHRVLHSSGCAKLCDFGLARIMTNATHILTSIKGTPLYMAPELIEEKPYDHQADLWSLGCIVYELTAGQPPFCTMSILQLVRMIRHKPVQWPSFISTDARSFLQGLLHKDPMKRMSWPEILEHPFISGHVLILPEDVQKNDPPKAGSREHDLRSVHVMHAVECVPMSDDDSVRATSALSVRDSLKTDDEESSLITAANAKLLRHEYNVMNNSNLVVCNLENNMAQLIAANKKQTDLNKMDKIDEEKLVIDKLNETIKADENKKESVKKAKSIDTASHSLENPKSTKCSSDVSSGLSKSVPPSYKQKLLQFSRDKFRFGSGGNRLTRSIKRSFHFSRSWDKNKGDSQRRTSEPTVEIPSIIDDVNRDKEKCSKEDRDEDIEKSDIIEETCDEKDVYLEAKVVYNFVAAINTLMKDSKDTDEAAEDRLQGVGRMIEVCSWLCVRSCRGVRQLATALGAYDACPVFTRLLTLFVNIVGLLITILQDLPEHSDVVERILFHDKSFNVMRLLEQPSDALRMRGCILISLLCTFSCTAFSAAMESKWSKQESACLEALHTHCNVTLNRAARLATKELGNMPFYVS